MRDTGIVFLKNDGTTYTAWHSMQQFFHMTPELFVSKSAIDSMKRLSKSFPNHFYRPIAVVRLK
jgi:hypothetical protein